MTSPSEPLDASHPATNRPGWYQAMLPVIDLRHGRVVRGVRGERESYRPVESRYVKGSDPGQVAEMLIQTFGFSDVYVADLDAICDGRPDSKALHEIHAAGLQVWLDAGIGSLANWRAWHDIWPSCEVTQWIIGLETLESWREWERLVTEIGTERLVFSLDLQQGNPRSSRCDFEGHSPCEIARQAVELGASRLLLLDLAAVGTGQGVTTNGLLKQLSAELPEVVWLTGGGIGTAEEVERQQSLGAARVLIASALHAGQILPQV